jgi:hypothetical protein
VWREFQVAQHVERAMHVPGAQQQAHRDRVKHPVTRGIEHECFYSGIAQEVTRDLGPKSV